MSKFLITIFFLTVLLKSAIAQQYTNISLGGLCSTSLDLSPDGTFTYESGCEGSSSYSLGTWSALKDTLFFKQLSFENFKIIDVKSFRDDKAKTISVTILDQTGRNITNRLRVNQTLPDNRSYTFTLDTKQEKGMDLIREKGVIVINSIEVISKHLARVSINSNTDFTIVVNIPDDYVFKIKSNWANIGQFKMLKRKDSLFALDPTFTDFDGTPARKEFWKD